MINLSVEMLTADSTNSCHMEDSRAFFKDFSLGDQVVLVIQLSPQSQCDCVAHRHIVPERMVLQLLRGLCG